jgi:hypothetical protein
MNHGTKKCTQVCTAKYFGQTFGHLQGHKTQGEIH